MDKKIGEIKIEFKVGIEIVSEECNAIGDVNSYLFTEDGEILPVEESELHVTLPDDIDFSKPGNPLENHPTWKYTTCKKSGMKLLEKLIPLIHSLIRHGII